ncbi:hypothetical protein [Streptomyces sp. NPDC001537]
MPGLVKCYGRRRALDGFGLTVMPGEIVPRLERLISTFVIGFAASEASGRFTPGALDPRSRRGQLPDSELPGHSTLGPWLDLPVDLTAEFEADLADIRRLVTAAAQRQG